jgi:hypothetical protein
MRQSPFLKVSDELLDERLHDLNLSFFQRQVKKKLSFEKSWFMKVHFLAGKIWMRRDLQTGHSFGFWCQPPARGAYAPEGCRVSGKAKSL